VTPANARHPNAGNINLDHAGNLDLRRLKVGFTQT
jgi:hypothetical protein